VFGHFLVVQGGLVVQEVLADALGFEEYVIVRIQALDSFWIESVGHQATLQGAEKLLGVVFGGCRGLRCKNEEQKQGPNCGPGFSGAHGFPSSRAPVDAGRHRVA
jgi:hypothetical protein